MNNLSRKLTINGNYFEKTHFGIQLFALETQVTSRTNNITKCHKLVFFQSFDLNKSTN